MRKLKSCSFYFIFISAILVGNIFFISPVQADATIVLEDILEENTHWTMEESPYLIYESLLVNEGVTLTIDSGVVIKFEEETSLIVEGALRANGIKDNPIYFTSAKDDSLGGDTNYDREDTTPNKGDWYGVIISLTENPTIELSATESSTLNNVISRYSSDGLLMFDKNISSEGLDIDNQILFFNSNSIFNKLSTFELTLFEGSIVSVNDSTLNSMDSFATALFDTSKLDITNSSIHGCQDCRNIVLVFDGSTLSLDDVNIDTENKEEDSYGMMIFDEESILTMKVSSLIGVYKGLFIDTDTKVVIDDSVFECTYSCIEGYSGSLSITNSKISGASEFGIYSMDDPRVTYENCREVYSEENGEYTELCDEIVETSLFELNNNEIFGNGIGIASYGGKIIGRNNNIHGNTTGAFNINEEEGGSIVDLSNNFWGNKTGPYNLSTNSTGLGNKISDNILYSPFLKFDPTKETLPNVMLIPGFEASRMYKTKSYLDSEIEDKLWEPNAGDDIRDLFMDESGVSIDSDIYTRDIVGTATVFGLGVKIFYKSFMDQMDELVAKEEIAGWKAIAYDWRLSPSDIVERGVENEDENISYNEELIDGQVPYIIDQLQKLVDSSNGGKVTIVVHSNGGLVAKALVYKLNEMKEKGESDLVDYIDNIIFVGSPILGTPESIPALLHGYNQGKLLNLLLSRKNARGFGQNLPGAYNLLPSEEYINGIDNDLITLDESLDKLNNWRTLYGDAIDNYDELGRFLSGVDGGRSQPNYDDLRNPLILNESLLAKAKIFHENLYNLVFPETIKIHQVAGWGIPTTYDLKYKSKNECEFFLGLTCLKKKLVLSSDVGLVSGGDGTVIAESALVGDGMDYYLNLGEYNKKYPNKTHANMFGVSFLFDLVHNIIKGDSSLPEYITTTQPSPVDFTVIKMHSPVAIDIYNEDGLHTGMVENDDPDLEFIEENIPNSSYLEVGDEKYLIVPRDENYKLELSGLSDGIFTLEQESIINNLPADSVVFRDISTTSSLRGEVDINTDSLATSISLDKEGDGIFESTIYPSIGEEDEYIEPEKHHSSSGSIPLILNKIPEAKVDIPILVVNTPDTKDVVNPNMKEISLEKIKYNLPENIKSNKNTEIIKPEFDNYNPNISASAGNSGIISKRTAILGIVASLILLISFILIFKIKI